jgi:dolichol-phosphate mannosyltransferase
MTGTGLPPDASLELRPSPDVSPEVSGLDWTGPELPDWRVCVALAAALRGVAVLIIPVLPEEAYHWLYAKHLDFGYYDHPPMIAWLIGLGTALLGDSPLGIRLFPWLCSIGTSVAAAWTARRLYGDRTASWTALILAFQPVTLLASSFGFPDSPLLLFWTIGLACVVQALQSGKGLWWIGAGVALGAGMLSKYTAMFLGASLTIYLLVTSKHRSWLKSPWPYLGAGVALVVFSPVVVWNATHDWASLRFQTVGRLEEGRSLGVSSALAYVFIQAGSIMPLTFPAAVAAVVSGLKSGSTDRRFLLCLSLPLLGFFFCVGFIRSTHAFWPLPAWVALSILTADYLVGSKGRLVQFYRNHWGKLAAISIVAAGIGLAHSVDPLPGLMPIRSLRGWDAIAERALRLHARLPVGSFYLGVGRRYMCAAQLAYHLHAPKEVHSKNLLGEEGLQFTYWADLKALRGQDAVIVAEADWSPNLVDLLRRNFRRVDEEGTPLVVESDGLRRGAKKERYVFYVGHEYDPIGRP